MNTVQNILTAVSRSSPSVRICPLSPSRPMAWAMPQGRSAGSVLSRMSQALRRWSGRPLLEGLYRTMERSAFAAQSRRFTMVSHAVRRSLRLMTAKSWVSGAPSRALPLEAAVIPGMTEISGSGFSPRISGADGRPSDRCGLTVCY